MTKDAALALVSKELDLAIAKHSKINSAHEGWAIIYEELTELWAEVMAKEEHRKGYKLREEAAHTAVTAIRFLMELC